MELEKNVLNSYDFSSFYTCINLFYGLLNCKFLMYVSDIAAFLTSQEMRHDRESNIYNFKTGENRCYQSNHRMRQIEIQIDISTHRSGISLVRDQVIGVVV